MALFGSTSKYGSGSSASADPAIITFRTITSALDDENLKYTDMSREDVYALRLGFDLKNYSNCQLFVILDSDGESYRIRSGVIMSVPDEKRERVMAAINKVNCDYRWGRFFIDDDGDLMMQEDVDFLDQNKKLAVMTIVRAAQILDAVYPEFMRAQWA
jgi:hypothetical protein